MPRQDDAVSEVVSFILVLAVIAASVAITIAVLTPEIEKSQSLQRQTDAVATFADLKTGIDQLWIFEKPNTPASLLLETHGTYSIRPSTLTFSHSGLQETANLLTLSYITEPNINLIYEGGAVFEKRHPLLKHSTSDTHAIFICSDIAEQTISTNRPILLQYSYHHADTYTNVTNISITNSANTQYWQKSFKEIDTIALIDYSVTAAVIS